MLMKRLKRFIGIKVEGKLKSMETIEDKLTMAEVELKDTRKKLVTKIVDINEKKHMYKRKVDEVENMKTPNQKKLLDGYEEIVEKLDNSVDILSQEKLKLDEKIESFSMKKAEIRAEYDLLNSKKEVQQLNIEGVSEEEDLYSSLIDEIDEMLNGYQDELNSTNELLEKGVLKNK